MLRQLQRHRGSAQIPGDIELIAARNVAALSRGNPGVMFVVAADIANAGRIEQI